MSSTPRPPDAEPPEPPARADAPDRRHLDRPVPDRPREVISVAALAAARLLRLTPLHGPRPSGQRVRDALEIPRWALLLTVLLTFLLFLSLLIVFFLPTQASGSEADGINFDKPTKEWYQGPVRYIITRQEVKAYKALENEIDRQNFIDWFWQRRDIVPETPQNEFRDRFEQRTFEATRKFNFTTKPGWKTDMGKIYILVGPPDEINSDLMGKSHRGIVTWVYRRPPFPDLNANTVVAFARDPSGDFVVSTSPTMDSDVARGLRFRREKMTVDGQMLVPGLADPVYTNAGAPVYQSELQTMMTLGRLQQLPPKEEELFKSFVAAKEYYGSIPLDSRVDFYQSGKEGTYTTITVGIRSSSVQYRARGGKEVPDVVVFGKLVNKERPAEVYPLASDTSFAEADDNVQASPSELLIFQATGAFRPGKYQLILGVQDKVSQKVSAYRRDVDIPDFTGDALRLSSITLAGSLEPMETIASLGKPFQLGKFRLVPRPNNTFHKDDELDIYFQVYNPAVDASTGKPRLDVLYLFRSSNEDGTYKDLGTYPVKDSGGQVQGYAVPLDKWPVGSYQVLVTVKDKISNNAISSSAEFVIRP